MEHRETRSSGWRSSVRRSGRKYIRHGGAKAYYSPGTDHIQMPPRECFTDEPHYYSTALHELTHWTGADHRLKRLNNAPFGSPDYAKEEAANTVREECDERTGEYRENEAGEDRGPLQLAVHIPNWR
jgi:antirestriction protein ArdC